MRQRGIHEILYKTLTPWLALSMGGTWLYILLRVLRDGSVRLQEPNPVILYFEIAAYSGLVLFGLWLATRVRIREGR